MLRMLKALFSGNWNRFTAELALFNVAYVAADYPGAYSVIGNNLASNIAAATIASAATITLDYAFTFVSGTTNVTAVKVRTGFRGLLVIMPTGALPLVSGGTYVASDGTYETLPVKVSKTGAAGVPIILVVDGNFVYAVLSA